MAEIIVNEGGAGKMEWFDGLFLLWLAIGAVLMTGALFIARKVWSFSKDFLHLED